MEEHTAKRENLSEVQLSIAIPACVLFLVWATLIGLAWILYGFLQSNHVAWFVLGLLLGWFVIFWALRKCRTIIIRRADEAIQKNIDESESKINSILDAMPDQLSILDKNLNILWTNKTSKRLFGDDIVGKKCYAVYHDRKEPCDPYPCFLLQTFEDGKAHSALQSVTDNVGNITYYECFANVIAQDEDGKPSLVLETIHDITEQRETEAALAVSNRRLQSVLDASTQVAIISADPNGTITLFNTGAERMLGYKSDEIVWKETPKIFHLQSEAEARGKKLSEEFGEKIEGFEVFVARARRGGYEEKQWTYIRKDGAHLTVNLAVTAVKDESGSIVGFLGVASDVTKQKKAEDEMRRSEARFRDIATSMSDWIWECDSQARYTYCSDQVIKVLGYTAEEILGKTPFDLMPEQESRRVKKIFSTIAAKKLPFHDLENCNATKDGREVVLSTSGVPIFDEEGNCRGYRGVDKDVTMQKKTEQELNEYAAALERNNQELAELNEAVEMASRAKSEFLANMSHEIRTPMTAILGFSEILIENLTDQELLDAAKTIKQNGEYLIGIINDILDLSKIEAGKMEIENIPCSPNQILMEVVALMRVRANAKNLSLEIEYDGTIPEYIQSDPTRLRQILINLVGNSIKFTEIGKIRLVTRLLDDKDGPSKIQFEIIDSGIGMTSDQIARLFEPFSQVDASTTRARGGSGLGLAISKRLAEHLGGDITVNSTFGEGSTFTVTIRTGPLSGVKMLERPSEEKLTVSLDKQIPITKIETGSRVLLAEDGPDNQRLISFLLKRAGAKVRLPRMEKSPINLRWRQKRQAIRLM